MVQGTGFEPAKHYALGPKPSPFDHSGTPACFMRERSIVKKATLYMFISHSMITLSLRRRHD